MASPRISSMASSRSSTVGTSITTFDPLDPLDPLELFDSLKPLDVPALFTPVALFLLDPLVRLDLFRVLRFFGTSSEAGDSLLFSSTSLHWLSSSDSSF